MLGGWVVFFFEVALSLPLLEENRLLPRLHLQLCPAEGSGEQVLRGVSPLGTPELPGGACCTQGGQVLHSRSLVIALALLGHGDAPPGSSGVPKGAVGLQDNSSTSFTKDSEEEQW